MWPFKPSYPAVEQLELPDRWTLAEGQYRGKPLFVRRRDGLDHAIGHPAYPVKVGVAVPLKAPDGQGFPRGAEAEELAELEDSLAKQLELDREAVLVLVISTNGMREFVFYAHDIDDAYDRLRVVEASVSSHELQFALSPDPKWSVYRQFA